MTNLRERLQRLLQPRVVVGLVLSAVLLAFVLSWADVGKVGQAFTRFPPILLPVLFALTLVREAIRIREWRFLLNALNIWPRTRHATLALLAGDASQIVPAGIYFQNYLLQRTDGASVSTSLAATLAMQLLEAAVALAVLCVIGVPGWGWLRPTALVVAAGYVLFLLLVSRPGVVAWLDHHASKRRVTGWLMEELKRFLQGLEGLMNWRVILRGAGYTAAYLAFTISAFWVIVQAYGLPGIGPLQALVIYCFVLGIIILNPLPSDLGISELSGVGIFLAFGVRPAEGLTVMLIARFALLIFAEIMAVSALIVFRGELRHISQGPEIEGEAASEPMLQENRGEDRRRTPVSPPARVPVSDR